MMTGRGRILWLDLGDIGDLDETKGQVSWQDHGLGLLRTILHNAGIATSVASTRNLSSWAQLPGLLRGFDMVLMNVRSYTFPMAKRAAEVFKSINPSGIVIVGGMHATVAIEEMKAVQSFDKICMGSGEGIIIDLVTNHEKYPRTFPGSDSKKMDDWPMIRRELWPKPKPTVVNMLSNVKRAVTQPRRYLKHLNRVHPLETECGWGKNPVATIITSRVCPWQCVFCNEASYIPAMTRRSVSNVIHELNTLDDEHGPLGSVVVHDSMFFQNPSWLKEWITKYPRDAHKPWPYWAAARSDTVREWPDLFEDLIRKTNWNIISIGFESGSDRILKLLNKGCTREDNDVAIAHLNRIGDEMEEVGLTPPRFFANIMLGIPGETREDAFETMRMLRSMKRVLPSISYYAPYPGSVLGYQLIAEGKSLMSPDGYHRHAGDRKVKGVDYDFYDALIRGEYDDEIGVPQKREHARLTVVKA